MVYLLYFIWVVISSCSFFNLFRSASNWLIVVVFCSGIKMRMSESQFSRWWVFVTSSRPCKSYASINNYRAANLCFADWCESQLDKCEACFQTCEEFSWFYWQFSDSRKWNLNKYNSRASPCIFRHTETIVFCVNSCLLVDHYCQHINYSYTNLHALSHVDLLFVFTTF